MNCENCGKNHDGKFGSGRFCCLKCSRSFSTKLKRLEINEKISKSLINKPSIFKGKIHTKESKDKMSKIHKGKIVSDETKIKISRALKGRKFSEEEKAKLKCKTGGWRKYSGLGKRGKYCGIFYQSSWELKFLEYCFANNIMVENCKEVFNYEFCGVKRKYHPDFYLPETDEIIEIKGFAPKNTKAKIEAVKSQDRKIKLLDRQELEKLGIIV